MIHIIFIKPFIDSWCIRYVCQVFNLICHPCLHVCSHLLALISTLPLVQYVLNPVICHLYMICVSSSIDVTVGFC